MEVVFVLGETTEPLLPTGGEFGGVKSICKYKSDFRVKLVFDNTLIIWKSFEVKISWNKNKTYKLVRLLDHRLCHHKSREISECY